MTYRLLAIWRLLFCKKFHLVTYTKKHLRHMNSSFNQVSVDYEWLQESEAEVFYMQQADENLDFVKNYLNGIK